MQDLASKHSTRPGILFISTLIIIACALELRVLEAQDCGSVGSTLSLLEQADVDGFQADHGPCDRVLGSLQVEPFNGPITDLSPLADLTEVGEFLTVEGTFSDLMGLHNLTTVGKSFRIEGDATPLTDLTGLDSLASADVFHLSSLYSLTSLSGMPNLAAARNLHFVDLPVLPNLDGLPAVVDVQALFVRETQMTSLHGAPVMSNLQFVQLDSTSVADLSALSASTFVSDPPGEGTLEILFTSELVNLTGLPIGEQFGSILIANNSGLTSLAGLENLVELWSTVHIYDNDQLGDCSTLATVLDDIDDGDPGPGDGVNPDDPPDTSGLDNIRIENNGEEIGPEANCNSIEEIVAGGEIQVIHEDGFESETI